MTMRVIFRMHVELMMGNKGSNIVELAASWAIVMILSGLFLWWPRGGGVGEVLYPRLRPRKTAKLMRHPPRRTGERLALQWLS